MGKTCELVVIGGGAAGMMCAIQAASRGVDTVILEPNRQLGRKLRITGKGRCNVTNNCDIKEFMANIPGDGRFLYSALNRLSPADTINFFENIITDMDHFFSIQFIVIFFSKSEIVSDTESTSDNFFLIFSH